MVLPAPPAPDAPDPGGRRPGGWLDGIHRQLRLNRAGILILVDHARPERLGELVRSLLPELPDLDVYTDVRCTYTVPHGATLVLAPRASDADWLNLQRPVFARRALRVILWCDTETTLALHHDAIDFFDWISHRHACPPGVPAHSVAGIRGAVRARAAGVAWMGGDLDACFQAALPGREMVRVSAARPYAELLEAVKTAGPKWLGWDDVRGPFQVRRVRWALAEVGRSTRAVLIEPKAAAPGWWPVHGRMMPLGEARERLEKAGATAPGRLAALVGLEPEAVEVTAELLVRGMAERAVEAAVREVVDPGAALVGLDEGLGFELDPPVLRATRGRRLREVGEGDEVERLLRKREARDWKVLANEALNVGDAEVASQWVASALANEGSDDGATLLLAAGAANLGGRESEASTYLVKAIEIASRHSSVAILAQARAALAEIRAHQGEFVQAEALAREALDAVRDVVGERDPGYESVFYHLGRMWLGVGNAAAAESAFRDAIEMTERTFGTNHPASASMYGGLGTALAGQGKLAEAERILTQARAILGQTGGGPDPSFANATIALGTVLARQGRYEGAENLLRNAILVEESMFGSEGWARPFALRVLGEVLVRRGRAVEATDVLREAIRLYEGRFGREYAVIGECLTVVAEAALARGVYAEAEVAAREGLEILERALGTEHPGLGYALRVLANVMARRGQAEDALALAYRGLALASKGGNEAETQAFRELIETLSAGSRSFS